MRPRLRAGLLPLSEAMLSGELAWFPSFLGALEKLAWQRISMSSIPPFPCSPGPCGWPPDSPANKTPTEIATLVWEIAKANRGWGLWPIRMLVAIDHFSRKVACAFPLEGPNARWIIEALEQAVHRHDAPKHGSPPIAWRMPRSPSRVTTAFLSRGQSTHISNPERLLPPATRTEMVRPLRPVPPVSHTLLFQRTFTPSFAATARSHPRLTGTDGFGRIGGGQRA